MWPLTVLQEMLQADLLLAALVLKLDISLTLRS